MLNIADSVQAGGAQDYGVIPDALVNLLQREAEEWAPKLDDDIVILALRRRL